MKYRRMIATLSTVALLIAMLAMALSFVFLTPSQYADSYYGALPMLYKNLKETEGKKIVIIGTSNVAFGVDSELIEEELVKDGQEYRVCNFGLYGAIGTKVMLDLSRKYIHEGDIVLFTPELNAQALSLYFSGLDTWRGIDGNWEMLFDISQENLSAMVGAYPTFLGEKMSYAQKTDSVNTGVVYNANAFNAHGDMKNADRKYNVMVGGYDSNNPITLDGDLYTDEFCFYVNDYYKEIKKVGASMYFTFAPMNRKSIEDLSQEKVEAYYSAIDEKLNFPIISNPNAYIMDSEWFYDSNFHLNEAGMTYRTIKLIEDLKNVLGVNTPVTVPIPEKPEIPQGDVVEGNNQFAEYFLYEEIEEGYTIVGLTEEGKGLTEIVIPASYQGKSIISFGKEVFSGNTNIKSITIQANIRTLIDRAFEGCTSLEKIYLQQLSPENIAVGYQLLEGADHCFIYVKQETATTYLNNYFWSVYTARLKTY